MTNSHVPSPAAALGAIRVILIKVLGDYVLDDVEINAEMSLTADLGLESIDLITVGAMLAERYGRRLNLAAFLAEMDIDDVIALTVGTLVEFVVDGLAPGLAAER
ncbi:MAG TPA: acyl carrier protein [Mycobacteriales bacterium]|nr:acyl carrier protein [Mycobacteriales bacterium]HWE87917.1 acyl carrier protein [Pseudonocardiaceae bacterium]